MDVVSDATFPASKEPPFSDRRLALYPLHVTILRKNSRTAIMSNSVCITPCRQAQLGNFLGHLLALTGTSSRSSPELGSHSGAVARRGLDLGQSFNFTDGLSRSPLSGPWHKTNLQGSRALKISMAERGLPGKGPALT